jgi:hypothetical protein
MDYKGASLGLEWLTAVHRDDRVTVARACETPPRSPPGFSLTVSSPAYSHSALLGRPGHPHDGCGDEQRGNEFYRRKAAYLRFFLRGCFKIGCQACSSSSSALKGVDRPNGEEVLRHVESTHQLRHHCRMIVRQRIARPQAITSP